MTNSPSPIMSAFINSVSELADELYNENELANAVSARLADILQNESLLTAEQRVSDPTKYRQHILHVDPVGRFSVVSLVWLPGQLTPIHDHRCWCVVGVLEGAELEERFVLDITRGGVQPDRAQRYEQGNTCALVAGPTDIHRVSNCADVTTISIHVYGATITERRTSIDRIYKYDPIVASPSPTSGTSAS